MANGMSLIDILERATHDRPGAAAEAKRLITPWDGKKPIDARTYHPVQYRAALPQDIHYHFDPTLAFFIEHGGILALNPFEFQLNVPDELRQMLVKYKDTALDQAEDFGGRVLPGQPDENLVSVQICRVPDLLFKPHLAQGRMARYAATLQLKPQTEISDAVIIYAEAGIRRIPSRIICRGSQPVFEDNPILLLASEFPATAQVRARTDSMVMIRPPQDLAYA